MKKKSTIFLLTAVSFLLASCGGNDASLDKSASNIYEAIAKLQASDNYTLEIQDTIYGDKGNIYYTEDAYYNELEETGYIRSDAGVYKYSNFDGVSYPGEILLDEEGDPIDSIYGNGIVISFKDFSLSSYKAATSDSFSITKKDERLSYISMVDEDSDLILSVSSFLVTLEGDTVEGLSFKMSFESGDYVTCSVASFGKTETKKIDAFLDNGGTYMVLDDDFKKIRELFDNDNYTQLIYTYDETSGKNIKVGEEIFTKNYYYLNYDSSYDATTAAYYNKGYVGLDHKIIEGNSFTGTYLYYISLNEDKEEYVNPFFYHYISIDPDVTTILNYPSNLEMFSNFQYFIYDDVNECYFSSLSTFAYEIYTNFNLASLYSDYDVTLVGSGFTYDFSSEDESEYVITLKIFLYINNQYVYQDFVFFNFGTTDIPLVDQYFNF